MRLVSIPAALMAVSFAFAPGAAMAATAMAESSTSASNWAVGSQYDSTHVYVAPEDLDRFVASFVGTFGGTPSKKLSPQLHRRRARQRFNSFSRL